MEKPTELETAQRRALARLTELRVGEEVYLAGGGAVAAHLRHRISLDVDLFGPASLELAEVRERLGARPGVEVIAETDATLRIRIDEIPVDIVRYPYPELEKSGMELGGVRVASIRDLAAMKLAAIARRGIRRDFWDLHEMVTSGRLTLPGALDDYVVKFSVSQSDLYHVLRALTYFDDAEREPVFPRGLSGEHWAEIKHFFRRAAAEELGRRIALHEEPE
jgi:hypothetical protein